MQLRPSFMYYGVYLIDIEQCEVDFLALKCKFFGEAAMIRDIIKINQH